MIPTHPWTDGYVVAVAWHAVFNYGSSWNRLRDVDPDLSADEIQSLLDEVEQAGNPVGPDTPPQLAQGAAVRPQVDRLYAILERVRRAVADAFVGAAAMPDQIWARCRYPRAYMTLPSTDLAPTEEVEIIHLGDLPPSEPEWRERARLVQYSNLKVLTLFNMQLGRHPLGIDLPRLRALRCLDLRENGLEAVPVEVLRSTSLEWLDLSGNPLRELPSLASLPALAFLGIGETRVPKAVIEVLRRERPQLEIEHAR
jgi:Leucine-rich repeat (LRR) protein